MINPRSAHLSYRPDIDGLRAIAVAAVVLFHLFPGWLPGGFVGVDVFFVISGYLLTAIIARSLDEGVFSLRWFYARRIRRIFPALLAVIFCCLAGATAWLFVGEVKLLSKHALAAALFCANLALYRESGYFDVERTQKPLLHLWSLGIEEQFYLAWPLILSSTWRAGLSRRRLALAILAASFGLNVFMAGSWPRATFFWPITRFWELLVGGILAIDNLDRLRLRDAAEAGRHVTSILGLALIAGSSIAFEGDHAFPGWRGLAPTLGAAALIFAGPEAWVNRTLLSNRALILVGLISYPLYLWHWPLLSFAYLIAGDVPSRALRCAIIPASLLVSWLTYRWIESPIRSSPARRVVPILCLGMALLALAAAAGYWTDGFAWRLPTTLRQLGGYALYAQDGAYSRRGRCLLAPEQDERDFAGCSDPSRAGATTVLLWGDSHAAHLYPGFRRSLRGRATLTQLTAAGCPPIVNSGPNSVPHCGNINQYVLTRILREKPDRVVLAADWGRYQWPRIADTVVRLRKGHIPRVDIVGPVPRWRQALPRILYRLARRDPAGSRLVTRTSEGLEGGTRLLDRLMRRLASQVGANYISALDILCDREGCLTEVGHGPGSLVAWDRSHLTVRGSEFLVSRFPP